MARIDNQFHYGIRVPDIEATMADMSAGLGVSWCQLQERNQPVWTPDKGAHTVELRFTYSMDGPMHIELLQGASGRIWNGDDRTGMHHTGIWCDSVAESTEQMIGAGWTLLAASLPPEQGYGAFAYVQSPDGLIVEPVTSAAKPMFDRWFAGGPLG